MSIEDPGMDALRGSFGTFGSIIRARSAHRMSQNSGRLPSHRRPPGAPPPSVRDGAVPNTDTHVHDTLNGMKRHQLYDAPVPRHDTNSSIDSDRTASPLGKHATIKFDTQDVVYKYDVPGSGEKHTTERRVAVGSPSVGYPPLPSTPSRMDGLPPSSSHRNMDLLGISEENVGTESGSAESSHRRSVEIPTSRINWDPKIHSAPPTVHQRFAATMSGSELTPSRTSLLSFPSVTDSGPSENWEDPEMYARRHREWDVERESSPRDGGRELQDKGREKSREKERPRVGKRYPGASEDDDREESISLWDRSRMDEDEGMSPQEPSPGGIRLVQPKRPDMF